MMILFLFLLTVLRLLLATSGHLNEAEAYFLLCGHHLDWGFVEGPAGVPALIRLGTECLGTIPLGVRLFSPLLLAGASLVIASLARSLHGEKVAWWSVVVFNFLPLTNAAALVMEGTIIVAAWWVLTLGVAWKIMVEEKQSLAFWGVFGVLISIGTQFSYSIGLLLFIVFLWKFFSERTGHCYAGIGMALFFLVLGWCGPLSWNFHHDWFTWKRITWNAFWNWQLPVVEMTSPFFWNTLFLLPLLLSGMVQEIFLWRQPPRNSAPKEKALLVLLIVPLFFYFHELGKKQPAFSWLLVLVAFLLPGVVELFLKKKWLKKSGLILFVLSGLTSLFFIIGVFPSSRSSSSYWNIPSVRGVAGLQSVAVTLLRWRATHEDPSGKLPFIIAQSPGLAALLGSVLPITYPELPKAPSVFVPESPGLESQFQFWPHYAEATTAAILDPLYTEEKVTSPFFGRDAFYVTSETAEELPQAIHGAFSTVEPLEEVKLQEEGREKKLFIYYCKNYQMLAL